MILYDLHLIRTAVVTPRCRHDTVAPAQSQNRAGALFQSLPCRSANRNQELAWCRDTGSMLASVPPVARPV